MKKLLSVGIIAMIVAGFVLVFIPVSAVTPPLVFHSQGVNGQNLGFLTFNFNITGPSHALVVFEWIGVLLTNACNFILTPSDSFTNTWSSVGNCIPDANGGAIRAFSVASSTQSGLDTINCNFGSPNTQVEACYVFDVANPGAITLLASSTGQSNRPSVGSSSAASNSLILITAGLQFYCQSVVGGDSGFQQYIPSSDCNTGGGSFSNYGMAGGLENIGPGGFTSTFPLLVSQAVVWSELVVQVAPATVTTTTTTFTATITGWLTPDSVHFSNSLILIILPLAGMVFMLMPMMMFQKNREIGDKAIYPALFGLMAGATLADLSESSNSSAFVPFADVFVIGLLLFLWWWSS